MDWFERLKKIKTASSLSTREISEISNLPGPTLEKLFSGQTKNPGINTIQRLVHSLGYTLYDIDDAPCKVKNEKIYSHEALQIAQDYDNLDTWGQQAVRSVAEVEKSRMKDEHQKSVSEPEIIASIPYAYDLAASAGLGEYAMDIAHFETVGLSETPPHGADFLIRIDGDSMEPKYSHNDKVYVRRQDTVNEGEIGLFYLDGNVYIKKQGYNELISLNPKYDPIPVPEYSTSKCFGRILGKCDSNIIEL